MKNINTATFRLNRFDISLLLAVLLLSFLLFMEEEEEGSEGVEEEAYENLYIDLGKMLDELRDLQIDINNRKLIRTEAIDNKIDSLIQMVSREQLYLNEKVLNRNINKRINIVSEILQAQNLISHALRRKNHYSSEELNILLDQVERIWKQIQIKVKEAVRSAYR